MDLNYKECLIHYSLQFHPCTTDLGEFSLLSDRCKATFTFEEPTAKFVPLHLLPNRQKYDQQLVLSTKNIRLFCFKCAVTTINFAVGSLNMKVALSQSVSDDRYKIWIISDCIRQDKMEAYLNF